MLVLSRKAGEKILIGDKISVTVVRIGPGVVRIGVDAPDEFAILREELKEHLAPEVLPESLAGEAFPAQGSETAK